MMLPSSYSSKSHKLRHKRRHHLLDTPLQTLDALLVLISEAPFLRIVEKKLMGFDWLTGKLKGKELYVGIVGWVVLILHIPFRLVLPFFPNCTWSLKRIVQYFNLISLFFFQIDLTCQMIKILSSSTSQPSSFIQATLFHLFFILFSFLSFIFFDLHLLFPFIFFPKVVITVVVFHLSTLHVFFSHFQINNLYKII